MIMFLALGGMIFGGFLIAFAYYIFRLPTSLWQENGYRYLDQSQGAPVYFSSMTPILFSILGISFILFCGFAFVRANQFMRISNFRDESEIR